MNDLKLIKNILKLEDCRILKGISRQSNYRLFNKNCNLLIVNLEMKDRYYQDKDETLMLDRCCKLSGTSNCSLCVSFLSWRH